jgi:hypothetical protein
LKILSAWAVANYRWLPLVTATCLLGFGFGLSSVYYLHTYAWGLVYHIIARGQKYKEANT